MSIFSKLLKKTVGIPEVNINKLPFANKIVGDWESKSMEDLVKQLPKETISRLVNVCNSELDRRSWTKLVDCLFLLQSVSSLIFYYLWNKRLIWRESMNDRDRKRDALFVIGYSIIGYLIILIATR